MLQIDYNDYDFNFIRNKFNLNMINLANMQSDFVMNLPKDLNTISALTNRLSNLTIIAGNSYLYKRGNQLKEISNVNVLFDNNFNTFKLNPIVSYKVEVKENENKLITNKQVRIFNKDKSQIKNIDDLLVRGNTINISTEENNYKYTLNLNFSKLTTYNNIYLKLNDETLSYPTISEIYYVNTNREKISVKLLNNGLYNLNIDLFRNSNNIYSIDLETITADNIYIVLEDNLEDLIIDKLDINYTEYTKTGSIILEALVEDKPILKVGVEAKGDVENVNYSISYNATDWFPIVISNTYSIEKTNKVVSFNTIDYDSILTDKDVKTIYLKMDFNAIQSIYNPASVISRNVFRNGNYNITNISYTSISLYESTNSIFYGKESNSNIFDYTDLYDSGEYVIVDNYYYVKGMKETGISKTYNSKYNYSPVSLKSKELKIHGEEIDFNNIDISTKEIYSYKIDKITKNLLDSNHSRYVLPLKENIIQSEYYIKQADNEIKIDLSLGYINSTLDVLCVVEDNDKVYLLDSFKNLVLELPIFKININNIEYSVVSLLDTNLFENLENLSKTYPLIPIKNYELGLLNNTLSSINLDREVTIYNLTIKRLYTEDTISTLNTNYSTITSKDDYKKSILTKTERTPRNTKQIKLTKNSIVKGSIKIEE